MIPIVSILAWIAFFPDNWSGNNIVGHWLLVYPLSGIFMMINRVTIVKIIMEEIKKECEEGNVWANRLDSIENEYKEFDDAPPGEETPVNKSVCTHAHIYRIKPRFTVHDEIMKRFEKR